LTLSSFGIVYTGYSNFVNELGANPERKIRLTDRRNYPFASFRIESRAVLSNPFDRAICLNSIVGRRIANPIGIYDVFHRLGRILQVVHSSRMRFNQLPVDRRCFQSLEVEAVKWANYNRLIWIIIVEARWSDLDRWTVYQTHLCLTSLTGVSRKRATNHTSFLIQETIIAPMSLVIYTASFEFIDHSNRTLHGTIMPGWHTMRANKLIKRPYVV